MATDLSALLCDGVVLANSQAASRKQIILQLAEALAGKTGLEARRIVEAVMVREQLGSTGIGDGVAIPHARIHGVEAPVGAFARLDKAVDFDAVDERECDLIFMLLAPDSAGADHLRALAQVSRAFREASVRDRLRQAKDEDGVRAILCRESANSASAA